MSQTESLTTGEVADRMSTELSDRFDDDPEGGAFAKRALREIVDLVESNREDAIRMGHRGEPRVEEVLAPDNIASIDVLQNGWNSPTVRVWLNDAPIWANDADRREFRFSASREDYNGNPAHAVIDVRPM